MPRPSGRYGLCESAKGSFSCMGIVGTETRIGKICRWPTICIGTAVWKGRNVQTQAGDGQHTGILAFETVYCGRAEWAARHGRPRPESVGHLAAPETPCRSSRTSGMEVLHARLAEMAVRGVFEHVTQVAGCDMEQALVVNCLQIHSRLFHQRIVPH